jgi:hypothetical protein
MKLLAGWSQKQPQAKLLMDMVDRSYRRPQNADAGHGIVTAIAR